jgi:hypothetical protein
LASEAQSIEKSILAKRDEKVEANRRAQEEARQKVIDLLDKKVVGGITLNDDQSQHVKRALFDKTETINIDGQLYKTTLYNKMLIEAQKDPEKNLSMKINFLLGNVDDSKTVVNKAKQELKKSLSSYVKSIPKKDILKPGAASGTSLSERGIEAKPIRN